MRMRIWRSAVRAVECGRMHTIPYHATPCRVLYVRTITFMEDVKEEIRERGVWYRHVGK